MFEKIRKPGKTKKIVNYVIFGLICLVFIFIGVPVSQISDMGGAALIVNNKVISWSEYRKYLEMLEQQQSSGSFGGDLEAGRQEQLRQKAVDTLLNTELVIQEAEKLGVVVAKKEVQDKVVELPFFQEEGRFMHSKYRLFLESRSFSPVYFENLIRKEIQTTRFQNIFNLGVSISKLEEEKRKQLANFSIQVSYVQFPTDELKQEEFDNINRAVETGDVDLLNQMFKSKNWKWETIDSFDLSRISLPGLDSSRILFDEVLYHLPKVGIIKKLISLRDQSFVLKVENFIQNKSEEKKQDPFLSDSFFTNMMMSRSIYLSWINSVRSLAKLRVNPRLQSILQSE